MRLPVRIAVGCGAFLCVLHSAVGVAQADEPASSSSSTTSVAPSSVEQSAPPVESESVAPEPTDEQTPPASEEVESPSVAPTTPPSSEPSEEEDSSTPAPSSSSEEPSEPPSSSTTEAEECSRGESGRPATEKWSPTEDPKDTVTPGKMRSDCEKIPGNGKFSKADADKAEVMEARVEKRQMTARAAVGCQVYWPAPYEVCGVIRDKYNSLGGPNSFLKFPISNEITNPGNTGKRSEFMVGPIYWSAANGAHPVVNSFVTKWGSKGWESGFLGYPKTDEIVNPDGAGRRQEFVGGAIYWHPTAIPDAASIGGAIRTKWNGVNAERVNSLLGYPTSDETVLPDGQGRMNRFERGVIYWSSATGAHPVSGVILAEWALAGFEAGTYKYPTSDEYSAPSGRAQNFQGGTIDKGLQGQPVSTDLADCDLNISWPEMDSRSAFVRSTSSADCDTPKRISWVTTVFWTKEGTKNEVKKLELSRLHSGSAVMNRSRSELAPCFDGVYRVRTEFTVSNPDGSDAKSRTQRTEYMDWQGCQSASSLGRSCLTGPVDISDADCVSAMRTVLFARWFNGAAQPGYVGGKEYRDDEGQLPPPPIPFWREYDTLPRKSDGTRFDRRVILDEADKQDEPFYFTADHYTTIQQVTYRY